MPQLRLSDPGLTALRHAARAAIVMPAVFAFADKVIGNPQTAVLAAFGSFAMLVLADFAGPMRSRFIAFLGLAGAGVVNIVLGTLCSRNAWVAAAAMAVVGFAILFSGAINGYFAAAGAPALLTFILPVTLTAPFSEVPARLGGWGLAAGVGICAQMLLWPARPRAGLRRDAAKAAAALAELVEAELAGDPDAIASGSPASSASTSSARAAAAFAASRRRPARGRAGQSSICAQIPTPAAKPHPPSRAGTSEKGAVSVTGRMNVSRAGAPAAAK